MIGLRNADLDGPSGVSISVPRVAYKPCGFGVKVSHRTGRRHGRVSPSTRIHTTSPDAAPPYMTRAVDRLVRRPKVRCREKCVSIAMSKREHC